MAADSLFKPVSLAFSSLIFIQSIVWGILSILAILCIHGYLEFDVENLHGLPAEFTTYVYILYLSPTDHTPNTRIFPNDYFIYIFWAYFLFSIFLVFTSGTHILLLTQDAKRRKVTYSAIIILILVFASCIYDVIAAIIFGLDYVKLQNLDSILSPSEQEYLLSVPIFMATLAAKGYVLWLFNFILAIIITDMLHKKVAKETHLEPDPHIFSRTNSAYDAFGDSVLSSGTEMPPQRRMTQMRPREMSGDTYAIPVASTVDDGRSITSSWARMPRQTSDPRDQTHFVEPYDIMPRQTLGNHPQFVEPYDFMTTRSTRSADFEPTQQYATPFASSQRTQLAEPEPDYSPEPNRRMAWNPADRALPSIDVPGVGESISMI